MASYEPTTNFKGKDGEDLGKVLVSKDYLLSVYPQLNGSLITLTPELWVWGSNTSANLGISDATNISTPVTTFAGGTNWKQVSAGGSNTAAIKTDGTLWVWGTNVNGELGTNDGTTRSTPVTTFAGGTNWKQVSAGNNHTTAIKTDGTLWTWGSGSLEALGTNDTTTRSTPVTTFAGGTDWKQVSCKSNVTAAIKTDGTLWTWGDSSNGVLGLNGLGRRRTPVTTFAGGTDWKQVSVGDTYILAIKTNGTLWGWGSNGFNQLGINDGINRSTPITTFAGGTNWKQSVASSRHSAAIKTDGTLWVWGNNLFGWRLATNDSTTRLTPVTTFAGGTDWKQVSSGEQHTAAIKTDGTLWIWGRADSGQLGTNDTINRSTPVTTFAGGTNWKQVSSVGYYTIAIQSDNFI